MLMVIGSVPAVMAEETEDSGATRGVVWVESDSYLNVRSGPGVTYPTAGRLGPSEMVTVLGVEMDADGVAWLSDSLGQRCFRLCPFRVYSYPGRRDDRHAG